MSLRETRDLNLRDTCTTLIEMIDDGSLSEVEQKRILDNMCMTNVNKEEIWQLFLIWYADYLKNRKFNNFQLN